MFRAISCSSSGGQIVFYVSLTLHHSITLANDQLDAQFFNTFITILYMYMFRAISCSSSGGQIVFYVSLTLHHSITLANDQLDAQILIHLLQSSTCTCFEQYLAHPQEVKLYFMFR